MSNTEIIWTKRSEKDMRKIAKGNPQAAKIIYNAVDTLLAWPNVKNVRAIVNGEGYRLTVRRGNVNHRVLFSVIEGRAVVISVTRVKPRNERTYKQ